MCCTVLLALPCVLAGPTNTQILTWSLVSEESIAPHCGICDRVTYQYMIAATRGIGSTTRVLEVGGIHGTVVVYLQKCLTGASHMLCRICVD